MCIIIYHNNRWGKSRKTLQLLRDNGYDPEIIEYLKTPLSEKELTNICGILKLNPIDIIRKNEMEYKQIIFSDFDLDNQIIRQIAKNPKLMERPIVIKGEKGIIGRPPENVLELL